MNKQLRGILLKLLIVIIIVLFFIFIGKRVFNSAKYGEGISGVRKELSNKYDSITCIKEDCNGIIATLDDKVLLFDVDVSKLAAFNNFNDNILDIASDYYITFIDNIYYVKDFDNKVIYKSKKSLNKINDNLILENGNTIINNEGKVLYKNLDNINLYYDNKYIVINKDNKFNILDSNANILFKNKKIDNVIRNEYNEEEAFIIYDEKTNKYNYYNIEEEKLYKEEFISYDIRNGIYVVTNNNTEYILKINGDMLLLSENKDMLLEKVQIKNDGTNIIILNSDKEEVINIKSGDYLYLSDNNYVYLKDNNIKFYNIKKDKTYLYELEENEKLNYEPFRKTIFVYNDIDKYVKLVDFKGNLIKKIDSDNQPIIKFNLYKKSAYIITVNDGKYGMYIAK